VRRELLSLARFSAIICGAVVACAVARAQGGAPFESVADDAGPTTEGAVWDFSKPLWAFFAQERLLAPETPLGEALPRMAVVHMRPAGERARLFFILAGIGYLGLYHVEHGSAEYEASVFTMLVPLSSVIYYDGVETTAQQIDSSWTDVSLRFQKTFGAPAGLRTRIGGEYQVAFRNYVAGEDTSALYELPNDTTVQMGHAFVALDTRSRGMTGDYVRGVELEIGGIAERRTDWNAFGLPGTEYYDDPATATSTTIYGSLEAHKTFDTEQRYVLHGKIRGGFGLDLDRLTYIRLGGGGFGRQFDRVGAGSTGAANDGELFRSDGIPGYFGGEYFTDNYVEVNLELDLPAGDLARRHITLAGATFNDVLDPGGPWKQLLGLGLGFTRIYNFESAVRWDVGYSPRPDGAFSDTADITFTYLKKF
jgi:hypothetical protein